MASGGLILSLPRPIFDFDLFNLGVMATLPTAASSGIDGASSTSRGRVEFHTRSAANAKLPGPMPACRRGMP